ncbi:ubiquitin-like modifier-activating enzyme 5 [Strigomonas culicis]|uniref:Ubiquitin-like modifier-activating enzyme 5 n=1 Tax=Strigomonas culicis TaxID=28005 RepID=S9W941_9TRYP|nr:ubiquitin-like modifier-activating enzyme 5 [Strigomonas culicis]|eukprot:EPY32400.1 ubiquitin-like modifier-activating enzyme 5 [Strigomonas culicis]
MQRVRRLAARGHVRRVLRLARDARPVATVRVGLDVHLREVVPHRVVADVLADRAELQKVLERVLRQEAGDDAHRRRQRGRADALALRLRHAGGHDERRAALVAGGGAGQQQLDVAAHRVLRDAAFHPRQPVLQADLVDRQPRLEVVHAAEQQVDRRLRRDAAGQQRLDKGVPLVHRRDAVGARHDGGVGVDALQRRLGRVHLRHALLLRAVEESVHVGELHLVVVKEQQLADAAAREHLGDNGADAAGADDGDGLVADRLVVLHNAHPLQGHEAAVRVVVAHLRAELLLIGHVT